eukprot:COSAG05_NODE_377_length_10608_cov_17.523361_12_plen_144_part_00
MQQQQLSEQRSAALSAAATTSSCGASLAARVGNVFPELRRSGQTLEHAFTVHTRKDNVLAQGTSCESRSNASAILPHRLNCLATQHIRATKPHQLPYQPPAFQPFSLSPRFTTIIDDCARMVQPPYISGSVLPLLTGPRRKWP